VAADAVTYETTGDGVTYFLPPLTKPLEITGPVARNYSSHQIPPTQICFLRYGYSTRRARRCYSSAPTIRVCRLRSAGYAPRTASSTRRRHSPTGRSIATTKSSHSCPTSRFELDIEIWPTSIVIPPGYRFGLNIRGHDYDHGLGDAGVANAMYRMTGIGPFLHTNEHDRPAKIFGSTNTLHFEAGKTPYLLLPVIP